MIVTVPVRVPVCVGVKSTLILQLFPAANVLPQGFRPLTSEKSPLATMLLMFRVPVPELARSTTFGPFVVPTSTFPQTSEVGVRVTAGFPPAGVTVSFTVVVCVMLPDTPVTVTVEVPTVALALAVKVNVLVVVAGLGLKAAVTPLGNPEALKVTLLLNPFCGLIVILLVAVPLCATDTELGFALKLKLAVATTVTAMGFDSMPFAIAYRL